LTERKGRIGETRDVLEDVGSKMKCGGKGARNIYHGLLLPINQQAFFVQAFKV
jgi:hypothetical protein